MCCTYNIRPQRHVFTLVEPLSGTAFSAIVVVVVADGKLNEAHAQPYQSWQSYSSSFSHSCTLLLFMLNQNANDKMRLDDDDKLDYVWLRAY